MRRAIARGRIFPQSYSIDRRMGRLSLKACAILPLMWANADDQGRLSGDPEEIKYAVCPNIDHITKSDIPELLKELQQNKLIKVYDTPKSAAIQLLDWWDVQRPQWAWPSEYPPADGWNDRLRYKKGAKEVVTLNWFSPEKLPEKPPESSPETADFSPLTTPSPEKEEEEEREEENKRGRGRGNSPEGSGEESTSSPSLVRLSLLEQNTHNLLTECFKKSWAQVPAGKPWQTIPRAPKPKEAAQLRDLAKEISSAVAAGRANCPPGYISDAFNEAASQGKMTISYVRAIILDWMGIERVRSP